MPALLLVVLLVLLLADGGEAQCAAQAAGDACAVDVAGAVPYGGELILSSDVNWFSFAAVGGQNYVIYTELGSLTDPQLELLDDDGVTVLHANDDCAAAEAQLYGAPCTQYEAFVQFTAPDDGTYYVRVFPVSDSVGTYDLTVRVGPERVACATITCADGTVADDTALSALCAGNPCQNSGADNALCCNERAACPSITCAEGTIARPIVLGDPPVLCALQDCDNSGADNELCCSPRAQCSTIACADGTVADLSAGVPESLCQGAACDASGLDNEQCCNPRAACSTIECAEGWVADPTAGATLCAGEGCDNSGPDNDLCCSPRAACSTITCAPGTIRDPSAAASLCADATCDSGQYEEIDTATAQSGGGSSCLTAATDVHCRDVVSGSITCDTPCDGGVWGGQSPTQTPDNELCCDDRAPCESITCFDRTVADDVAATALCSGTACDNTALDNVLCCEPRAACSSMVCPTGFILDLHSGHSHDTTLCAGAHCDSSGPDADTCCVGCISQMGCATDGSECSSATSFSLAKKLVCVTAAAGYTIDAEGTVRIDNSDLKAKHCAQIAAHPSPMASLVPWYDANC